MTPVEVLQAWRESALGEWPLSSFVIQTYGSWGPAQRASRMRERVDQTFEGILERLKLEPGSAS